MKEVQSLPFIEVDNKAEIQRLKYIIEDLEIKYNSLLSMESLSIEEKDKEIYSLNRQITALESNKEYLKESKARLRQRIKSMDRLECKFINELHSKIQTLKVHLKSEKIVNEILRDDLRNLPFLKKVKILFFK